MPNVVGFTLPVPKLAVIGQESDTPNITGAVALSLPTPVMRAVGDSGSDANVAWALPTPTLQITGYVTAIANVAMALPSPTLVARGVTGLVGDVAMTLPSPTLDIRNPNAVTLTLPTPTLVSSGAPGVVGSVSLVMPTPTLQVVGKVPLVGVVDISLPAPKLVSSGFAGITGSVAMTLRGLALAVRGATGIVGGVSFELPIFDLDVEGFMPLIGVARLTLPHLQLQITGTESVAANFSTLAMHTETKALWQYDNFQFNSYAKFNGMYLAAGQGGLFTLGGDTDDGALIDAAARVGITDFGTSYLKRVDRAYVGYRTTGNLVIRVFTDEVHVRDYLLQTSLARGLHGNHTRIGKGLAARYWQFEVRNMHGSQFELNIIELKPTHLRRRIGGNDA